MGLIVSVMRNADGRECTNGGVSSKAAKLCVVNVEGPFDPSEKYPAVRLELSSANALRIVPVVEGAQPWFMMGGNYAATSDSRFNEACKRLLGHGFYGAVAIHDRVE